MMLRDSIGLVWPSGWGVFVCCRLAGILLGSPTGGVILTSCQDEMCSESLKEWTRLQRQVKDSVGQARIGW